VPAPPPDPEATALATVRMPRRPRSLAALLAHAERQGWQRSVAWEPAGPTNTGPQFIVTLSAEPFRGRGASG